VARVHNTFLTKSLFITILASSLCLHAQSSSPPPPLLLGTAWYPEQWPESRWEADLTLMQQSGIHMVRVGEFAWSRYKLVVAPGLNVLSDAAAKNLIDYVRQGGHLVLGQRSAMKNDDNGLQTERQRARWWNCSVGGSSSTTLFLIRFWSRESLDPAKATSGRNF
jgi:beta-galactosidase GanA